MKKYSKYNFIYPFEENENSKVLIFNARSGCMATLDEKHYDMYTQFVDRGIGIPDETFEKSLEDAAFIIPAEQNELEMIRYNLMRKRFNTDNLTITIAPTMSCNFSCIYCYEKSNLKRASKMSEYVQDKIVDYIEAKAKLVRNLHISWYGGEPTLAFDIIDSLSKRMIGICDRNEINYWAHMTTNGYNLTQDIIDKFGECRIKSIQVTIDGPKDVHDVRRPTISGKGTFDRIIENLLKCKGKVDSVAIRINTDIENYARVDEVVDALTYDGISNTFKPYLGHVDAYNDQYMMDKCMTVEMYSKQHLEFKKRHNVDVFGSYPRMKANYCGADAISSIIIDPEGDLYKCWSEIGNTQHRVGNLLEEQTPNSTAQRFMDYMIYDPTLDTKCIDCSYLPVCMGGCPFKRLEDVDGCCDHKFTLEAYLRHCAKDVIERRKTDRGVLPQVETSQKNA